MTLVYASHFVITDDGAHSVMYKATQIKVSTEPVPMMTACCMQTLKKQNKVTKGAVVRGCLRCLTCDLAEGEVVTHVAIWVPCGALNAVGGAGLQVGKGVVGAGGVEFDACVRALHDNAEAVEDSVLHWLPAYLDGVGAGRGGVHGRSFNH